MEITPPPKDTIRTSVFESLDFILGNTARQTGLAIVRGPVGIGKTYALRQLAEDYERRGVRVNMLTCRTEIEGNVRGAANEVLHQYSSFQKFTDEAGQALWNLIRARPFAAHGGQQSLLIADEAQGWKPSVLHFFRGLWDMGDGARLGNPDGSAFGLVLVGNSTFLNRKGVQQEANFGPLMSRATLNVVLDRPTKTELRAYAASPRLWSDPMRRGSWPSMARRRGRCELSRKPTERRSLSPRHRI